MIEYLDNIGMNTCRIRNMGDPLVDTDAMTLGYMTKTVPFNHTRCRVYVPFQSTSAFSPLTGVVTGATITNPVDATAPFCINLNRGTTAANNARINSAQALFHFGMVTRAYFECYVKIRTAMPDATNDYTVNLGFCDSSTADPADGAYWALLRGTSTTNWVCCTANNSTRTLTASSVAVTLNTWYRLAVEVLDVGGGTRNARFYNIVNDVPSLIQTTTTNIPITSGREFGITMLLRGIAGTTDRVVSLVSCFYDLTYASIC